MSLNKRIIAFTKLGKLLKEAHEKNVPDVLNSAIENASKENSWFSKENILHAIESISIMLEENKLKKWIAAYDLIENKQPKKIAVIMAGNIPLVGFHDFLCVLISGNSILIKLSSADASLLPAIAKILCEINPEFKERIKFIQTLPVSSKKANDTDTLAAIITTGSNNSAKYFEYYFGKYPHIIRKNRNSVAILTGNETESELKQLGQDIFQYFGLGCRNVSKIYIPRGYNLDNFFSAIVDYGDIIHHHKYANNYNYYRSIYLLNTEKFLDNNFVMLKESSATSPPTGTLFYEYYENDNDLSLKLNSLISEIQCISSLKPLSLPLEKVRVEFGKTQQPELWDYSDRIDTIKFLNMLK